MRGLAAEIRALAGQNKNRTIKQFVKYSSADLELLSMMIFVDRESTKNDERLTEAELIQKVHEIKPHFNQSFISAKMADLSGLKLLKSLGNVRTASQGAN
jgi:hypothetical protein